MKKSNEAEIIELGILYLNDCIRMSRHQFAYRVDCGNTVHKSCCGRKDAPTVHLLRASLLASSQKNSRNLPGEVQVSYEYIRMVLLRSF